MLCINVLCILAAGKTFACTRLLWLCVDLIWSFQRTSCPRGSPPLTWVPSWKWWNVLGLPQCSVLLVETLTQKLPGSRIFCQSTRPITTDESSSSAQVTNAFILPISPFPSVLFSLLLCFYHFLNIQPSQPLQLILEISVPPKPLLFLSSFTPCPVAVPLSSCRGYWLCFSAARLCCCSMSWLCMVANPSKLFKAF